MRGGFSIGVRVLGWVLVGHTLLGAAGAAENAPVDSARQERPAAAKHLFQMELQQLKDRRAVSGMEKKTVDLSALEGDADFAKAFAALGIQLGDVGKIPLEKLEAAGAKLEAEGDGQSLSLLAAALKFATANEANPGQSPALIAQNILLGSLGNFKEADSEVELPAALQDRLLKALAGDPAVSPSEKIKVAGATDLAAALNQGDPFLRRSAERRMKELHQANSTLAIPRGPGPGAPAAVQPAPGLAQTPEQRARPDAGGGCLGGALPAPADGAGGGRMEVAPAQRQGLAVQPVEFNGAEAAALNKALQERKSLTMEVGQELRDRVSGRSIFNPLSLCQATVVEKPQPMDDHGLVCRFVLASAKHCFASLQAEDSIRLSGFKDRISARNRQVIVSGGEGEDFAAMLVDAPCNTPVPVEPLAPADFIRLGGGQKMVMDVQRTGAHAIAGRTAPSRDGAFLGVNVAGQGRIFPGDSGGRFSLVDDAGQTFFAGVTSSKLTNAVFRDAVGNVAVVPQWLRDGLTSGSFFQSLPENGLVAHAAPEHLIASINRPTH